MISLNWVKVYNAVCTPTPIHRLCTQKTNALLGIEPAAPPRSRSPVGIVIHFRNLLRFTQSNWDVRVLMHPSSAAMHCGTEWLAWACRLNKGRFVQPLGNHHWLCSTYLGEPIVVGLSVCTGWDRRGETTGAENRGLGEGCHAKSSPIKKWSRDRFWQPKVARPDHF